MNKPTSRLVITFLALCTLVLWSTMIMMILRSTGTPPTIVNLGGGAEDFIEEGIEEGILSHSRPPADPMSKILILPHALYGPNNQRQGLIAGLDFCQTYNLTCLDPFIYNHYSIPGDKNNTYRYEDRINFSSIYDTAGASLVARTREKINPELLIWAGKMLNYKKYLKNSKLQHEIPIDLNATSWSEVYTFLQVRAPGMKYGDVAVLGLYPNTPEMTTKKFDEIRRIENPYLPAKWLQVETLKQLSSLGLHTGFDGKNGSNFISFHLRLWDACFNPDPKLKFNGTLTLDTCCCGSHIRNLSNGRFGSAFLESYIKLKMREAGVERALILAHPILSDIKQNTGWLKKSPAIAIWPSESESELVPFGDHPLTISIMQQYMLSLSKETYLTTKGSSMTRPVHDWRKYFGLSDAKKVKYDFERHTLDPSGPSSIRHTLDPSGPSSIGRMKGREWDVFNRVWNTTSWVM